jgi:hypothetical protein
MEQNLETAAVVAADLKVANTYIVVGAVAGVACVALGVVVHKMWLSRKTSKNAADVVIEESIN